MNIARNPAFVQFAAGAALLVLLLLPPARGALEASMRLHMLAQYPALMLAGALMGTALPSGVGRRLAAWNDFGISGLAACTAFLTVLMIPRVLDLALVDLRVEAAKFAVLLLAGAVLRPSWRAAGPVIQGFFLGGIVPMTIVVGTLYRDAPLRLCNAYRMDDQQQLGLALIWVGSLAAVGWVLRVARRLASGARASGSA